MILQTIYGLQVGPLKKGLNPISIGNLVFTPPYLQYAVKAGSVTGFIALAVNTLLYYCLVLLDLSFIHFIQNNYTCMIFYGFCHLNYQEGIAVGRSLALMKNHHVDGNKEMIAFGLMNIAGSFTSCYLTTGKALNLYVGI